MVSVHYLPFHVRTQASSKQQLRQPLPVQVWKIMTHSGDFSRWEQKQYISSILLYTFFIPAKTSRRWQQPLRLSLQSCRPPRSQNFMIIDALWRSRFFLKFWSQPGACTPPVHPFSTANSHQCRLSGKLLFVLLEPPHSLFVFYIQQTFVWNYIESHYVLSKLMLNILLCIAQKTNTNFGNIWHVKMRMMFFQL